MSIHWDGPRTAPVTTLLAGVASAGLGLALERDGAVPAALLAAVLVLVFFWTSALPLLLVGGDLSLAGLGFLVLMMTYALRLVGLHSHIGSQIFDANGFEVAAHRVIGLLRQLRDEHGAFEVRNAALGQVPAHRAHGAARQLVA